MRCTLRSVYAEHKVPAIGTVGVQPGQHLIIVAVNITKEYVPPLYTSLPASASLFPSTVAKIPRAESLGSFALLPLLRASAPPRLCFSGCTSRTLGKNQTSPVLYLVPLPLLDGYNVEHPFVAFVALTSERAIPRWRLWV